MKLRLSLVCGVMAALCCLALGTGAPLRAAEETPKIPEGWLLVEEDVWYQLADEPNEHFQRARIDYLRKDYKAAERDIRKGVAIMKLGAARSIGDGKKALAASILELETLAVEAGAGRVKSIKTLDRIFSRSFYALGMHNQLMASEHLRNDDVQGAGYHLRSAARDVETAMVWYGEDLADAAVETIAAANRAAVKMITEGANLGKEVAEIIAALHQELVRMNKLMEAAE